MEMERINMVDKTAFQPKTDYYRLPGEIIRFEAASADTAALLLEPLPPLGAMCSCCQL